MRVRHSRRRARCAMVMAAVTLMACAPALVVAQPTTRTTYGVLMGGTSSQLTDLNASSPSLFDGTGRVRNRYGVRGGLFVNRPIARRLSLQPEVYFIQKGTRIEATPVGNGSLDYSLSYIEIPLLLRVNLAPSSALHPFVTVGPSLAFRVQCWGTFATRTESQNYTCRELNDDPRRDLFASSDMGVSAGVGVEHVIAGRAVLLQMRYGRGLRTVVRAPTDGLLPKTSTFSVVAGVGLGH
jgi:hypothetical protein